MTATSLKSTSDRNQSVEGKKCTQST